MRTHHYDLTDETRAVLTDNVKHIAFEMDVNVSHLYQILSNIESDTFGKFKRMFTAAVRAGVDVTPWMAALTAIINQHVDADPVDLTHLMAEKTTLDAVTTSKLIVANKDGVIDEREAEDIRRDLHREKALCDKIDQQLPVTNIRDYARGAVSGRRAKQAVYNRFLQ